MDGGMGSVSLHVLLKKPFSRAQLAILMRKIMDGLVRPAD